jgi:hypothetical protein
MSKIWLYIRNADARNKKGCHDDKKPPYHNELFTVFYLGRLAAHDWRLLVSN